MDQQTARQLVDQNADRIQLFCEQYLRDIGVLAQLQEVGLESLVREARVNGTLPDDLVSAFNERLGTALKDVMDTGGIFGETLEYAGLDKVIAGAVSLELLVRQARLLSKYRPEVLPESVIPTPEVVSAALVLFHSQKQAAV